MLADSLSLKKEYESGLIQVGMLAFAGMSPILFKELGLIGITYKLDATIKLRNHDLMLISLYKEDIHKIKKLKTAEDLFVPVLSKVSISSKSDLKRLSKLWRDDALWRALNIKTMIQGRPKRGSTTRFAVFIKQDHDYEVYRKDISNQIELILQRFNNWTMGEPADVELWGFIKDGSLTICLRLTEQGYRKRNYRVLEREGSLRPTIAAGLVVVGEPNPGDIWLDPMCGSGTIAIERALFGPFERIYAGDIDEKAINIARHNLSTCPKNVRDKIELKVWNATALPLPAQAVDVIASNLPWGKKFNGTELNEEFYSNLLAEFSRVLKDSGRMVLLTANFALMEKVLRCSGLIWKRLWNVKILGTWAGIYYIVKNRG